MGIRELISRLSDKYEPGEAKAIIRLLLEQGFHLSWTDVLCGAVDSLTDEEKIRLEQMMVCLEQGEPVQYVLGKAEFYGRNFCVNESTLIPRPETEVLISKVLSTVKRDENYQILDIGTGSGCIAVTLALELPNANVEAWDISDGVIQVAEKNANSLGAKVKFRNMDVLNPSLTEEQAETKWDIIVSNPPYICNKEKKEMESNVLDYEPHTALFVPDDNPLLFYGVISDYATKTLNRSGILAFEVNRNYSNEVLQLIKNKGFIDTLIVKDQFENDRVVIGKWQ